MLLLLRPPWRPWVLGSPLLNYRKRTEILNRSRCTFFTPLRVCFLAFLVVAREPASFLLRFLIVSRVSVYFYVTSSLLRIGVFLLSSSFSR